MCSLWEERRERETPHFGLQVLLPSPHALLTLKQCVIPHWFVSSPSLSTAYRTTHTKPWDKKKKRDVRRERELEEEEVKRKEACLSHTYTGVCCLSRKTKKIRCTVHQVYRHRMSGDLVEKKKRLSTDSKQLRQKIFVQNHTHFSYYPLLHDNNVVLLS